MKVLQDIFNSIRHHFNKGGKFERYYTIFEAFETLFFHPDHVSKTGPHVRDSLDLKRYMSMVLIALLPLVVFGMYNTGYQSLLACGIPVNPFSALLKGVWVVLPIIIVSYSVGFFWEIVFAVVRKHNISEGFLVTGLLFPLILPPTIPLWQVAVGITFGVVIGKEIFGGTGRNILNPALTARAFLFFAYPTRMSGNDVWISPCSIQTVVDTTSGATPLTLSSLVGPPDTIQHVLSQSGYSLSKLFFGSLPGCVGETSTVLCVLGALFLIITGIASYRIIIGGIIGMLFTGYLLNFFASPTSLPWFSLNPWYHLIMGGFAFGIAFMATDPVTAPALQSARWLYGICIGMLTVVIRVFNPAYPEGVMLAILFMNLFAPLFDYIAIKVKLHKRIKNV